MGDIIWTYKRRGKLQAERVEAVVLGVFDLPQYYPPKQYLVELEGSLVIRDRFTSAPMAESIDVLVNDDTTSLYHD